MSDITWPMELFDMADLISPMTVRVAATLRLADYLRAGVNTIDVLAERTETDADALRRIVGHLVTIGVFTDAGDGTYGLGAIGYRLLSDDPAAARDWLDTNGAVGRADLAVLRLLDTVRTGQPAYPMVFGRGFWEDLAAEPALADSFDALMGSQLQIDASEVIDGYDWSAVEHVVDVGGGNATLLSAILKAYPHVRGTLVDLPGPAAAAVENLTAQNLTDRCAVVTGSFFDRLPSGGDVYVLSVVIHDWDDERASAILRRCATAAGLTGSVLVIEGLLDANNEQPQGTAMDIRMLSYFAGRERSLAEIQALGVTAALTISNVHQASHRSLIEMKPTAVF